ncbi:MAG: hypothetical protein H0W19_03865 [Nitrosopumilus sp.]|nr:hypothetical protein [Nitrosopumilus sp.]
MSSSPDPTMTRIPGYVSFPTAGNLSWASVFIPSPKSITISLFLLFQGWVVVKLVNVKEV